MKKRVANILALLVGCQYFATAIHAMDPIPPVRVGLTGLDAKTGEPLWERWRHEDLPDAIKAEIPAEIFKREPGFGRVIRPPQPEFGLPCVSGEFSIHLDKTDKGYFPEEITLIRKKNDQEISRKTFPNSGISVNALGEHFYFISPAGSLRVFPVRLEEGMDPWEPIREEHLIELPRNDNQPVIRKLSPLRIFVDQEEVFIQTPPTLFCFEENGSEKWRVDTSDFSPGGFYTSPPFIHFLEDFLYFQDGAQISKIDRKSGNRVWTTKVSGFWYNPKLSHLILSPETGQVITSATYFMDRVPDSFRRVLAIAGGGNANRELTEQERIELVGFVAELRAFGSRAMQVYLAERLDAPDRIPPEVKAEVEALLQTEWPEFRSEERRVEYLIQGLRTPPDHAFDRMAAWQSIFLHQWHIIGQWQDIDPGTDQASKVWVPVYEFWPGTERNALSPNYPSFAPFAREIFNAEEGVGKSYAALILTKLAGQPDGFTREEANQWAESADPRLRAAGAIAWAWFADRDAVFEKMNESPAESNLKDLLKQCLSLHPRGIPSETEIAFWAGEAEALEGNYRNLDFVDCFRIAHEGKFPADFEKAVRKVLRKDLGDSKQLKFAKFQALCKFDHPDDDDLIAEYAETFKETLSQIAPVIANREKRMAEAQ